MDAEEKRINEILEKTNLGHLVDNFKAEKVYVSTVPLLSSEQLKQLGVKTLGEQAILREACKHANGYTKISDEIRRIMQPLPDRSSSSSKPPSLYIERRKCKRRKGGTSKSSTPLPKVAGFQKKLVVFKYDQPLSFNRKDSFILLRGLLPEISLDATETEIRDEVISVLHSSEEFDLSSFTNDDFQFIDVSGKHCTVPICRVGLEFNGRSVKQMAGTGAVYVRLTRKLPSRTFDMSDDSDFEPSTKVKPYIIDSDSSFELPAFDLNSPPFDSAAGTSVSVPSSSFLTNPDMPESSSTSMPLLPSVNNSSSSTSICSMPLAFLPSVNNSAVPCGSHTSLSIQTNLHELQNMPVESPLSLNNSAVPCGSRTSVINLTIPTNLHELQNMFPSYSFTELTIVLEMCDSNFCKALNMLENCTLDNLLLILKEKFIDIVTEESPKIQIYPDDSKDDSLQQLLSLYKGNRFLHNAHVRVVVHGRNVFDSGGVRRQLYSSAFKALASGHLHVFDGPHNYVRPIIKPSNVISGLLKNIGKAIAHSLVMDQVGFPYLSLPIFYYLAGKEDIAVTLLKNSDVCGKALHVLSKLNNSAPGKLVDDEDELQYIESILDETGSDVCIEAGKKDEIIQTILIYNSLYKRKVYLDSLAEGLEIYRVHTLMKIFPNLFKPLFTSKEICSQDVINRIVPVAFDDNDDKRLNIISALFDFISELSSQELERFLCLVTGTHCLTSDCILVDFSSRELDPAVAVHTCSKTIVFSTNINSITDLKVELGVLLKDESFTMA